MKKKILLVIASLNQGGTQKIIIDLFNYWKQVGHDIKIITFDNKFQNLNPRLKKFVTKFSKFIEFFNKNEMVYFMFFRFIGGGGTPFPIQNVLPVIFNMSIKNYIFATFLGIIPATFVTTALGSGIENVIEQNAELNFLLVFLSPEIYLPILGFFIILILSFVLKNIFFKTK